MNTIAELGFAQSFFAGFQAPSLEFPFSKKDDRGSIENRLLSSLDKIFGQFHKRPTERADAVQRAFESSAPLVDNAVSITDPRMCSPLPREDHGWGTAEEVGRGSPPPPG